MRRARVTSPDESAMVGETLEQIEKVAAFGFEVPAWRHGIDTSAGAAGGLGLAAIAFDMVERMAEEFEGSVRRVSSDPGLSAIGRRRKIATIAREMRARLGTVRRYAQRLADEVEDMLSDGDFDPPASDTLKAAIWRSLERLDPLQVELAYRQALAAGDLATADAIESLPVVHTARLEPDRLAQLKSERISAADPEAAKKAKLLERATQDVVARANSFERRLGSMASGDDTDGIASVTNAGNGAAEYEPTQTR